LDAGEYPASCYDTNGGLHTAYCKSPINGANFVLVYGFSPDNGLNWSYEEIVDSGHDDVRFKYISLATGDDGTVYISYVRDAGDNDPYGNDTVKVASKTTEGWQIESISSRVNMRETRIFMDERDYPNLAYVFGNSYSDSEIVHVIKTPDEWMSRTLLGDRGSIWGLSCVLMDGMLHVITTQFRSGARTTIYIKADNDIGIDTWSSRVKNLVIPIRIPKNDARIMPHSDGSLYMVYSDESTGNIVVVGLLRLGKQFANVGVYCVTSHKVIDGTGNRKVHNVRFVEDSSALDVDILYSDVGSPNNLYYAKFRLSPNVSFLASWTVMIGIKVEDLENYTITDGCAYYESNFVFPVDDPMVFCTLFDDSEPYGRSVFTFQQ
jgi:hypothetical protein